MSGKRRAAGPPQQSKQGRRSDPAPASRRCGGSLAGSWSPAWSACWWSTGGFVYLYQSTDIPDPNKDFETQTSFVYYADGKSEVGSYATQNRESISLDEMPDNLQNAVVAAENRSFWSDSGIDPRGILRAAFSNAKGNATQGASTITQQYVKILYLTQERSYERKMKEAVLSLKLQRDQVEVRDPRGLPQHHLLRPRRVRRPGGRRRRTSTPTPRTSTCARRRCSPACSTTRRTSTPPTARTPARRSRSATTTSSTGWRRPATSPRRRPRRPSGGCRSSRRSRRRASTAARRATCSRMVRDELNELGFDDERDRRRRPAGHHDLHQEGDGRRGGRRRGAAARGQGVLGQEAAHRGRHRRARHRCGARLLRRPGLRAVPDQLGGHRWPGRLDVQALRGRRGAQGRASRSRTPSRATRRSTTTRTAPARRCSNEGPRRRQRLRLPGQPAEGHRGVDQHGLRRPHDVDARRPGQDPRDRRGPRHPATGTRTRAATTTSTTARASSRSPASPWARPRSRRSTWPTPTPRSPTAAAPPTPTSSPRS